MNNNENVTNNQNNKTVAASKGNKNNSKLIGIVGAIIAIIVIVVLTLFTNRKITIDLNNYVNINYSGVNGYGYANISIDDQKLLADHGEKLSKSLNKNRSKDLSYHINEQEAVYSFINYAMNYKLTPSENLSNKDELKLVWDTAGYDENIFGAKLKSKDKSFKVKGLEELAERDPFENVEFKFDGVSGNGLVTYNNLNENPLNYLQFEIENNGELNNDDKILVKVSGSRADQFINDGFILKPMEKEILVSGLKESVTKLDQIDAETIEKIHSEVKDYVTSTAAKKWGSEAKLTSAEYAGHYLLTPKNPGRYYNAITVVTKYTVQIKHDEYGINETVVGYYPVSYYNLMINEDGILGLDDLTHRDTTYDSFKKEFVRADSNSGRTWTRSFIGYENMDDLEYNYINQNLDSWNVQSKLENQ